MLARPAVRPPGFEVVFVALVTLIVSLAVGARAARAIGLEATAGLQALADSVMSAAMSRRHVPGGVLMVVQGEDVVLAHGYGFADLEHRVRVDPERTIFRVASVSKVLTATAAMQRVERGQMALDADVNRYLKRFRLEPVGGEPVTLFHLLTHTAGFDDRNIGRKVRPGSPVESLGAYLARRLPARIEPPGRHLCYSNHGMALAGYLVEQVSGIAFERYMHDSLFALLGMTRSSFGPWAVVPADLAPGYDESDPPERVPADFVSTVPASMLTTTGADMARFAIAHLRLARGGTSPILGAQAAARMQREQFTQHPLLPGIALGFWERFQNGERALWHDGNGAGFTSLLYLLPERGTGFFMVFNGRGGGAARREVLAALLDFCYPDRRAVESPIAFPGAAREAARCAGAYVHNRYGHRGIEKIARLEGEERVSADSGGTLVAFGKRYVAVAPLTFQRFDGRGYLVFEADERGRIRHLLTGDPIARVYERVPWYGTGATQLVMVGLCAVVFVLALLAWPLAALVRRLRRQSTPSRRARRLERLAAVLGGLNVLFLVGFGVQLAGFASELEYGVPPHFVALLALPMLGAAITVLFTLECARGWRDPGLSRGRRLHGTITALAALAFVAWLVQWNLLGFRW